MRKRDKCYVLYTMTYWHDYNFGYGWRPTYYSREMLVHEIAKREFYPHMTSILDNLSKDMSETRSPSTWVESNYYFGKYTEIIGSLFYIGRWEGNAFFHIAPECLEREIAEEIARLCRKHVQQEKWMDFYLRQRQFDFRQGPVPGTGKCRRRHYRCFYHNPVVGKSARLTSDPEYKEFETFKDKQRYLTWKGWDCKVPRHRDKSWKTSFKVKKQWQKHKNRHKYYAPANKHEYLDELDAIAFEESVA